MDNLRRADQLLHWTAQQQLAPSQLQQATLQFSLQPAPADWLTQANRVLLFSAALLLGCALIFFFAYNWPLMHYLAKFALAGAAVVLSGSVAIICPDASLPRRVALFGCAIFTGALLALIGQTYQTGADIWQLFAGWAALITPLVLLSKSRASYLLLFLLVELTLWRYLGSQSHVWLLDSPEALSALIALNLLLLLFCEFAISRLGIRQHKALCLLTALALLLPLTAGAVIGVWEADYRFILISYLIGAALMALWYLHLQPDAHIFALLLFSAITVSTALLLRLFDGAEHFMLINLLAFYVIGSSAGAALWIKKRLQEARHAH